MAERAPHSAASGLLLALAGFATLSIGDGVIKSIAGEWPGLAVAALRYFLGSAGLLAIVLLAEGRAGLRCPMPWVQLGRGACVAVATMCFFTAIFLMPLAEATAILFTAPMITALLSAVLLGERAPRLAWAATLLAFAGVLIVLRPNVAALGWIAALPLVCALAMSLLMILNRISANAGPVLLMQLLISLYATPVLIAGVIIGQASGVEALQLSWPSWSVVARCALVAVSASIGHMLLYAATTRASAAVTAPMTYVQLLVATAVGLAFYGERPDLVALGGAALIVVAGLIIWRWQRQALDDTEVPS